MKKIVYPILTVLMAFILVLGIIGLSGCSKKKSTKGDADHGATVNGTLTLPAGAHDKEILVIIDHDLDGDNGFVIAVTGTCGSGTVYTYEFSSVSVGTYYVYALVRVVSASDSPPQSGDYFKIYGGSLANPPSQPNAVVPSSGTVTFDITLGVIP